MNIKLNIPEEFFREETRCGYTISPEMKKVWAVLLDLLVEFMRVCDKHHLKYYMCGGSILGAVRHGGIIPWDDDIDVMMMREEYEKLIKIGPEEFKHPYFFQIESTDPGSAKGHIQIRNSDTACMLEDYYRDKYSTNQGLFLDVFPIDRVPERYRKSFPYISDLVNLRKKVQLYKYCTVLYRLKYKDNIFKTIAKLLFHLGLQLSGNKYLYRKYYDHFLNECQKYNNDNNACGLMLTPYPIENGIWSNKDLEDTVYMKFEMLNVPIPSGYEHILDCIYGDWHKFEVGTAIHSSVILDAEHSYLEYLSGSLK